MDFWYNILGFTTFSSAAVGVAKASGITAFAVDSTTSTAALRFKVKTGYFCLVDHALDGEGQKEYNTRRFPILGL